MPTTAAPKPPSLRRSMALGFLEFRRDPIGFFLTLQQECGDAAHFRFAGHDAYLFSHPDAVQEVLVTHHRSFEKGVALQRAKRLLGEGLLTSEGEVHTRQRRLMQPAFLRTRIGSYAEAMVEHTRRASERWHDGQVVDVHDDMTRLTLAIVAQTLFDADVDRDAAEIGEALAEALRMFDVITSPFYDLFDKLPLPRKQTFNAAKAKLDGTIMRIIQARRASGETRNDLLSMLLKATDTEGDGTGMSDEQLRDEALTIFLAGHETTATALTWTWYLLSQHGAIYQEMLDEVDRVLGGRPARAEDVARLPFVEKVFAEAIRLYPPAWTMGRRATADVTIGGYALSKGSIAVVSPYVVHHDPRFFPEPYRFDPQRWRPEAKAQRHKFSYFPFGGGPRVCIGEPFAWMEGVLLLATMAQQWRLHLVPDHPVALQPLITLRPKYGVKMRLERRRTGG